MYLSRKIRRSMKNSIRTLFSFLFPISKTIETSHNGKVKVVWFFGQKRLDSENANYSYDSLLDVLEIGVSHVQLEKVNQVLLLGMGGGSIIHSLRKKNHYSGGITAIEIDEVIIQIAEKEFGMSEDNSLRIQQENALDFVKSTSEKFDLIIVDLFIDTKVPDEFYSNEFWQNLEKIMTKEAVIIFNSSTEFEQKSAYLKLKNMFVNQLEFKDISDKNYDNQLLLIHRIGEIDRLK